MPVPFPRRDGHPTNSPADVRGGCRETVPLQAPKKENRDATHHRLDPMTTTRDLPAIAAYATMHGLGDEAAEAEWRFIAGEERERFRSVARAAVAAHKADGIAAGRIADLLELTGRLQAELRELTANHDELVNELLENAGDEWDRDEAAEAIAVRYVRHLEAERDRLTAAAEPKPAPACRVCDGSGKLTVPDGDGESASEQACPDPIHDRQQRYVDELHDLLRDMLQSLPDTADEQEWRDRAGRLDVHDPDGRPYRAYTEDDL